MVKDNVNRVLNDIMPRYNDLELCLGCASLEGGVAARLQYAVRLRSIVEQTVSMRAIGALATAAVSPMVTAIMISDGNEDGYHF